MKPPMNIIKIFARISLFILTFTAINASATSPLTSFTSICTLDESCAVDGPTLVAFGSGQQYVYKTLSGNFVCSANTFKYKPKIPLQNPTCLSLNSDLNQEHRPQPIQLDSSDALTPGTYAIISAHSGKALAIRNTHLGDGAHLVQQDFNQHLNQMWDISDLHNGYYSITALHSHKVLESQDWSNRDGVKIQQFSWINSSNQHWRIKALEKNAYQISSRINGHVIDLLEMNQDENGPACLWTNWGGINQSWKLVPISIKQE